MRTYDTVVVGGGIVGASTAYHLARAGSRTLCLDRHDEGRATDAGAGIIAPLTSSRSHDETWLEFAHEAADYYPTLVEALEREQSGPTSYDRVGMLSVALSADEVDPYERTLERVRDRTNRLDRADVTELDTDSARAAFPPLAPTTHAFQYPSAHRVDGQVLTDALVAAGKSHGLSVEAEDVTEILIDGASVTGVRTADGTTVETDSVVVAGGAWSDRFADQLGVSLPIEPQRGQIVHLEVPDTEAAAWPIVKGFRGHYMVPWPDGRLAVGATRETDSGYDPRTTAAGVREVLDEALRVAPGLADASIDEIRVGLRPASEDGLPVLGHVPDISGAFLATGHGPTGLTFGPYSGRLVSRLARGDEDAQIDAFSVERFD